MTMHDDGMERVIPEKHWRRIGVLVLVLVVLATTGWEMHWRSKMYEPNPNNNDGLWAIQRRAATRTEDPFVLIGSSRTFFDINLDVWESVTGKRPIQLALEGTSPRKFLTDLADDPKFTGTLLVGVTPPLFFFSTGGGRIGALEYYRKESPSQWLGQRIGMLLEHQLAFLDETDLPLFRQLEYIHLPNREGVFPPDMGVRQLSVSEDDRNTHMWRRVEQDSAFQHLARDVWVGITNRIGSGGDPDAPPFDPTPVFEEVKANVKKIRARGGDVVFIRCPSIGPWREVERKVAPREKFWDALLDYADVGGVHFEDNAALQGLVLPEWSHLSAESAKKFTRALAPLVMRALETRDPVKDSSLEKTDSPAQEDEK